MPAPIKVTINSKVYNIPILTGEMDNIAQQMESAKNEIRRSTERRQNAVAELENCSNTMLLMYIQQTGNYPE
ncbi:MAG: hypothetical protein ACRCZ2_14370 [Fusobacteriaceae bacterium]